MSDPGREHRALWRRRVARRLFAEGFTAREVGSLLGVRRGWFYDHPSMTLAARLLADEPHHRKCLRCSKPFKSEGKHNRICTQCKKAKDHYGWTAWGDA